MCIHNYIDQWSPDPGFATLFLWKPKSPSRIYFCFCLFFVLLFTFYLILSVPLSFLYVSLFNFSVNPYLCFRSLLLSLPSFFRSFLSLVFDFHFDFTQLSFSYFNNSKVFTWRKCLRIEKCRSQSERTPCSSLLTEIIKVYSFSL